MSIKSKNINNFYKVRKALIIIGLLLLIIYKLLEPFQYLNLSLMCLAITIVLIHAFEIKNYYNKLEKIDYRFKLRKSIKKTSKRKYYLSIIISVLFYGLSFVDIPFQNNALPDNSTIYIIIFILTSVFTTLFDGDYSYYFFADNTIYKPGYELNKIDWREIKSIDFTDSDTIIKLNFYKDNTIAFDLNEYVLDETPETIISFLKSKSLK